MSASAAVDAAVHGDAPRMDAAKFLRGPGGSEATARLASKMMRHGAKASNKKNARQYNPYLDRLAMMPHFPVGSGEFWRELLIQPIALPDMLHTGIPTKFDNPEEKDLLGPDGKSTVRLKSLIKNRIEETERAEREARATQDIRSPRGPRSPNQDSDDEYEMNGLGGGGSVENLARRQPMMSPKQRADFSHVKGKRGGKRRSKKKSRTRPSNNALKEPQLSFNGFKMFESMLEEAYGK